MAFFGTPIGASGFSGRYPWADVWDLMVDGKMLTFVPGQFEPSQYGPGDPAYLPRGQGKSIVYIGSTWMIDYARGLPITMLPFGVLAPASFVTLDWRSAWTQLSTTPSSSCGIGGASRPRSVARRFAMARGSLCACR